MSQRLVPLTLQAGNSQDTDNKLNRDNDRHPNDTVVMALSMVTVTVAVSEGKSNRKSNNDRTVGAVLLPKYTQICNVACLAGRLKALL